MNINTLIKQAHSLGYKGITLDRVCEYTPSQLVELAALIDKAMKSRAEYDNRMSNLLLKFKEENK